MEKPQLLNSSVKLLLLKAICPGEGHWGSLFVSENHIMASIPASKFHVVHLNSQSNVQCQWLNNFLTYKWNHIGRKSDPLMQMNYLEVIFRFYAADYIFFCRLHCTRATSFKILKFFWNGFMLWLVFHELQGRQLMIRLLFTGSFPLKIRGNPLKFHLSSSLTCARYGFPKHSIFSLHGVTCQISLLACGPRISCAFLLFLRGSFSNLWKLDGIACYLRLIWKDWSSSFITTFVVLNSHKTELNYRSLIRESLQKCTNFVFENCFLYKRTLVSCEL